MSPLTRRQLLTTTAALAPALLLSTGCGSTDRLAAIKKSGQLKVGIADERPYAYMDNGKAVGLVLDLILEMARPIGVSSLVPTVGSFDSLIPGLVAKHFDVIGAGTYIKPDRCKAVAFTNPLYQVGGAILVKRGNPLKLHSLSDVAKHATAKIGSQTGTSQVQEMADAGIPKQRTVLFTTDAQALAALTGGRVDVIYFPALQIASILKANPNAPVERAAPFTQASGPDGKPAYSFGSVPVNKDDSELLSKLNEGLKAITDSGKLKSIFSSYGLTSNEMVAGGITAEQLCK